MMFDEPEFGGTVPAGAGARAAAFLIDLGICTAIFMGLVFLGLLDYALGFLGFEFFGGADALNAMFSVLLLAGMMFFLYNFIPEAAAGRTPGKFAVGSITVRRDGRKADVGQSFLKSLLKGLYVIAGVLPIIDLLMIYLGGRGLSDRMTGTHVVTVDSYNRQEQPEDNKRVQ
jgi:uncharacterized RDD family membrane protein YckC